MMFEERARFDPSRDGKVPVARTPLALAVRAPLALGSMLFSAHPQDALRWLRSMLQRRRPLSYAMPWLTFGAIRALQGHAHPGTRIFEFGSGHSTLYWALAGAEIHAVEDDRGWHDMLAQRLAGMAGAYLYFEPTREGYLDRLRQAGGAFDIVVVDGSYRKECLSEALPYVKPGGLLVVDNTDWHWYDDVDTLVPTGWDKRVFGGWAPFIGHRSETTIWRSPATETGTASR